MPTTKAMQMETNGRPRLLIRLMTQEEVAVLAAAPFYFLPNEP